MAFCTNCGQQIADGVRFCTACGSPMTAPQETLTGQHSPAPAPHTQQYISHSGQISGVSQPSYAPQPTVYQEEPISTGGYIGILLLMAVPLVNLICLLVWACGGCRKVNKRNLSRAILVLMLIGIVLGGLAVLAGSLLFGDIFGEIKDLGTQLQGVTAE